MADPDHLPSQVLEPGATGGVRPPGGRAQRSDAGRTEVIVARLLARLPGPPAARAVQAVLLVMATLALLGLFYEWLGGMFLDTGGQIG